MKKLFALMLLAAITVSCSDIEKDVPGCIKSEIRKFRSDLACDEGATVEEYLFQGKTVYVFNSGSCLCDGASAVWSEDCEMIGSLGGFSGNTIINGESFSNAVYQRTVWKQ